MDLARIFFEVGLLYEILQICQHYNTSKVFNAFGFGAKLPPTNKVHFNFPLVRSLFRPMVGLLPVFKTTLPMEHFWAIETPVYLGTIRGRQERGYVHYFSSLDK